MLGPCIAVLSTTQTCALHRCCSGLPRAGDSLDSKIGQHANDPEPHVTCATQSGAHSRDAARRVVYSLYTTVSCL